MAPVVHALTVFGQVYFTCQLSNDTIPIRGAEVADDQNLQQIPNGVSLNGTQHRAIRDDYTYTPGIGAHKLHTRATFFNAARLMCEEEGGYLAIINSVAEARAVSKIFQNSEAIVGTQWPADAFIGFHDFFSKGDYVTIHGQSLQKAGYDRWNVGHPIGASDRNCGGIYRGDGTLRDLQCNSFKFGFICEIDTQ